MTICMCITIKRFIMVVVIMAYVSFPFSSLLFFLFFFEIRLIFILALPKIPLSIFRHDPKSNVDHEGQH